VGPLKKLFEVREQSDPSASKPFLEHLEDLRWMFIKMLTALGIAMAGAFAFRAQIARIIQNPLALVEPKLVEQLQSLHVADSFTISMKLAFYAGLVISFPLLLYFLLEFILPGLTKTERKYLFPSIGVGAGLFLAGALFCYFIVLPSALRFFYADALSLGWRPQWTVTAYFSFVTQLVISFGLCFEVPVVVIFLVKIGLLNHELLRRTRSYAVVIILTLAALITPTQDIFTLLCMGGPMLILYEACIWIAKWMEARDAAAVAGRS
jgi:sec-independent protein translocase protein TatC